MDIKITKKQNVKVGGVKYVAKPFQGCAGCAFDNPTFREACGQVHCADGRSVIFVKKEPKWVPIHGVVPALPRGTRIQWKNKEGGKSLQAEGVLVQVVNWAIGKDNEVTHYRIVKEAA